MSKINNTMEKFEKGIFEIERNGEIIQLTQKEIDEIGYLEMAIQGKDLLDNCINLNLYDDEVILLIKRMMKSKKSVTIFKMTY